MQVLEFSFNAVSPIFLVIFLGWFINRQGLIQEKEITFLNSLCFRYLLPVYIFCSVQRADISHDFNPKMFFVFIVGITVIAILSWSIFRLIIRNPQKRCIYIINSYRSNNLICALPLAVNLFGDAGLKSAAMLVPFTIICFNLYSVIILVHYSPEHSKSKGTIKNTVLEIIKNPLIIGSAIGILVAISSIKLPEFLSKGLNSIGSMASPLALLMLGSQIDLSALKSDIKHTIFSCLTRLVFVPLITTPTIIMLGFRGPDLSTLVIAFAAPCAIATFIMSRNYNVAAKFAAQTVYLSTTFSIFTIFILISILRAFKFI